MSKWSSHMLGKLCTINSGKSSKYTKTFDQPIKVYGANGVIGSYTESNFDDGFVVGRVGACGFVHKIDEPVWASDNTLTIKVQNPDACDKSFLGYELVWLNLAKYATKTAQPLLTQGVLKGIELPVPPRPEQRKISAILASVDDAIAKTEVIIDQTEVVKRGLMQQLLTKGIGHTTFKQTEIGEIPTEWDVVPLSHVLKLVERPLKMEDEKEYQLVTVKRRHGGVVPRETLPGKKILVKSQFYIREGDFLISKRQIVHGACEVVPKVLDGAIVSNEYHTLLVNSNLDMDYFRWFCRSPMIMKYFLVSSIGVHIEKMLFKLDDWLKRTIPLPSLEEQREIARLMTQVERSIRSNQDYLEKLNLLKSGLMQVLLTGKVRVNVDEYAEVVV